MKKKSFNIWSYWTRWFISIKIFIKKKYIVYGVKRRSSIINTQRIDDIYKDINSKSNFVLMYGDLTDASSILNLIKKVKPMKFTI